MCFPSSRLSSKSVGEVLYMHVLSEVKLFQNRLHTELTSLKKAGNEPKCSARAAS